MIEYEMSPLMARKLLEDAREQPAAAIKRHRRQAEGGGADGDTTDNIPGSM